MLLESENHIIVLRTSQVAHPGDPASNPPFQLQRQPVVVDASSVRTWKHYGDCVQVEREQKRALRRAEKAVQAGTNTDAADGAVSHSTHASTRGPVHLKLPSSLTPKQRALVHEAADASGVQHESRNVGGDRRLHIGALAEPAVCSCIRSACRRKWPASPDIRQHLSI